MFLLHNETSELAHISSHCVTSLTLAPVDANSSPTSRLVSVSTSRGVEEEETIVMVSIRIFIKAAECHDFRDCTC